jgi:serine/threonine protein kinase
MTDYPEKKSTWDLQQGDELVPGRFALKNLGGGHVYEAYVVWDDDMACLLVAKVMRPDYIESASSRRALEREADVVAALDHPLIVRGFGAELDVEKPHLLLEHLEGRNLRSVVRYGSIGYEQILPLALNICSAIHYMSRKGFVHLDIKSRNIIMGVPPRLIDLSLARTLEQAAKISSPLGTDAYMPPEQCLPGERGAITEAADVWGLGATLYRAVNNRVAFPRDDDFDETDPFARFPQLDREPDPFEKEVPESLANVIMTTLRPNPQERPSAMEFAASLEPFVAALPRKPVLRRARPGVR